MLPPARIRFVHVAMHRVDFRKAHDGLLAECYGMGLDPYAGDGVFATTSGWLLNGAHVDLERRREGREIRRS